MDVELVAVEDRKSWLVFEVGLDERTPIPRITFQAYWQHGGTVFEYRVMSKVADAAMKIRELPVVPEMEYRLRGCMKSSWCAGRARRTAGRNWKANRTKPRMHGTIIKSMIAEFASHFLDGDATLEVEFSKNMCGNIRLRAVPVEKIWVNYSKANERTCVGTSWIFENLDVCFENLWSFKWCLTFWGFILNPQGKYFRSKNLWEKNIFRFFKSC